MTKLKKGQAVIFSSTHKAATDLAMPPQPLWASALEQIYASVIDEPLPEGFLDLLDKLEAVDPDENSINVKH